MLIAFCCITLRCVALRCFFLLSFCFLKFVALHCFVLLSLRCVALRYFVSLCFVSFCFVVSFRFVLFRFAVVTFYFVVSFAFPFHFVSLRFVVVGVRGRFWGERDREEAAAVGCDRSFPIFKNIFPIFMHFQFPKIIFRFSLKNDVSFEPENVILKEFCLPINYQEN